MRIKHVRAENFRSLRHVDLELRPLTVVVGPNGAGKSSLLQLLHLFAGIENGGHMSTTFAQWGGYHATLSYGADTPEMKMGVTVANKDRSLDYDLELLGEGSAHFVRSETFTRVVKGCKEHLLTRNDPNIKFKPDDQDHWNSRGPAHDANTKLGDFRVQIDDVESFISATKRTSLWEVHKFQPSQQVRAPQQLQPTKLPAADGANLFSALYALKTEQRASYRMLLETLQSAVPELEELEFPLAGAGHVNMTWKQSNFSQPFFSNQLSDGILRLLWLVTVLHTVPDDGLVLLDEPELSLHPQWLMLVVSMLRKASARTNVLVATQSSELVRWLEPEEVVIANLSESGTTLSQATDIPNLAKWLDEFSLAELWTMGELGGSR